MRRSLARCCPAAVLVISLVAFVAGCSDQNETTVNPPVNNTDTQPPLSPAFDSWSAKDGGPLLLTWSENTEADFAGYNLYRFQPDPNRLQSYIKVNVALVTENSYTVTDAQAGVYEYYRLSSVDQSGNESALSSPVVTSFHNGTTSGPPPIEPRP